MNRFQKLALVLNSLFGRAKSLESDCRILMKICKRRNLIPALSKCVVLHIDIQTRRGRGRSMPDSAIKDRERDSLIQI